MVPSRAGFTIIEVIIVTLISALLAGVLFTSFWQTQRLEQIIDDLVTDDQTITRLYNQFEKDVNGFFVPTINLPKAPTPPVPPPPTTPGQKPTAPTPPVPPAADKEKPAEKITKVFVSTTKNKMLNMFTLTTNNVLAVYNKQKPLVARVVYRLEPSTKYEGSLMLTRQELSTLDAKAMEEKNKQTQAYIIADSVASLVLTFAYEETQGPPKPNAPPQSPPTTKPETKKVTDWDSDAILNNKESKQPLIPTSIEMDLTLRNATDGSTNQFKFMFPIVVVAGIEELMLPPPPPPPPMPPPPPAGAKSGQQAAGKSGQPIADKSPGNGLPQPKNTVVIMGARTS